MTIDVNVPQASFGIAWDQATQDLASSDGLNDVLTDAGVAADTDIGVIDRTVIDGPSYDLSWQTHTGVFFWDEGGVQQEIYIAANEQMGNLTAFERFLRRGLSNVLTRKRGQATICTGFAIEPINAPGVARLRWNGNNALSLRSGAVVGTY